MRIARAAPPVLFFILSLSCANLVQVKIDVVDQRTALENQVLGSFEEIGGDLLLLASVRSIDANGRLKPVPNIPEARKRAIRAMARSRFNQDDIERFKASRAVGETNSGYLKFFETDETAKDPGLKKFVLHIIEQENEDRRILYERIVAINENFGEDDLPKVEAIMAGLNHDSATEGEWIQAEDGQWIQKPEK